MHGRRNTKRNKLDHSKEGKVYGIAENRRRQDGGKEEEKVIQGDGQVEKN
jgi:hypothetical protein